MRMRALLAAGLLALTAGSSRAQDAAPARDLTGILEQVGLEPADLGLTATPDWLGSPAPDTIPYLLPHWQTAIEDPRRLVALGANLLHVARNLLAPERVAPDGEPASLLPLFTAFALQPRHPGFRGLPAPLRAIPDGAGALTAMLAELRLRAASNTDLDLDAVDHQSPLLATVLPPAGAAENALPAALRAPVARLLGALWQAADGVGRSWRHLPQATLERAVGTPEVPRLLAGGSIWWPALDDAARRGDDVERAGAALLVIAGLERAIVDFTAVEHAAGGSAALSNFDRWTTTTPWGRVIVAGKGAHRHECQDDCLLIVDLGGDDEYLGSAAAARAPEHPVSAVLDLGGDDRYRATESAAQGAGLGGVGVLFDLAGDDLYQAGDAAQGFGLLGYGLLWDAGGSDRFQAGGGAQGAAVFGAGLLIDGDGRDDYRLLGEGQGFGGPGACGALVDLAGNDRYFAEPDAANNPGRADYHSGNRVAAGNVQGAGVGRRGDQSDGQVWAGGVGVLADLAGDDAYSAGNFAQGIGYWFGTGLLLDGAGDDVYRSVYFSQASGSHFSLALLWDVAGDDRHLLDQEAGASLGYGWDFAASVFADGGGDDLYQARNTVAGVAELSSIALFLELGGDDGYDLPAGARALGAGPENPFAWRPGGPLRTSAVAAQVGLFVDLGGEDAYPPTVEACRNVPGNQRSWSCARGRHPEGALRMGAGFDLEQPPPRDALEWLGLIAESQVSADGPR